MSFAEIKERKRLRIENFSSFYEIKSVSNEEHTPLLKPGEDINSVYNRGNRPCAKKLSGPDGLEAWCVALAACFINFVMAGLARMSGILFVAFIDLFHIDRRQASLPFSVRMSVRNLLGPVVGILGQKYGVRAVTLFGGIVGTVSAAVCFFAKDILWVTIIWGVINGFGSALITTLPQVVIGQHFKKYRTTASGMAFSGGCIGSFLFPALLEFLLHTYGLGGTFLLISGIIMHTIPAAMILRKPTWMKKSRNIKIFTVNNMNECDDGEKDCFKDAKTGSFIESKKGISYQFISHHDPNVEDCNVKNCDAAENMHDSKNPSHSQSLINCNLLINNNVTAAKILTNCLAAVSSIPESSLHISVAEKCEVIIAKDVDKLCNTIEHLDLSKLALGSNKRVTSPYPGITAGSCNEEPMNDYPKNCIDTSLLTRTSDEVNYPYVLLAIEVVAKADENYILSRFPEEDSEHISSLIIELKQAYYILEKSKHLSYISKESVKRAFSVTNASRELKESNSFIVHIKTALKLYLKPLFLLICLCRMVHFLTFITVVTTIVDFSMDKGLLEEDGKYMIAALSFGDLMGRLGLGWITDRGYMAVPRYMLLGMVMQGASTAVMALMYSRATLMVGIAVFGLLEGSVFVRQPVLVSTYLGSREQSIAMGSINFLPGLVGFIIPSYIGYFRDTVGSYNGILYINGGIGAFVGILWVFEPYFRRISKIEDPDEPSAV